MNEELSNIIEQALHYATPLPVPKLSTLPKFYLQSGKHIPNQFNDFTKLETVNKDADIFYSDLSELGDINEDDFSNRNHADKPLINEFIQNFDVPQSASKMFYSGVVNDCESSQYIDNQNTERTNDGNLIEVITTYSATNTSELNNYNLNDSFQLNRKVINVCSPPTNVMECNTDTNGSSSGITPPMKRKRKRERNLDPTPPDTILPPCRVCDEKSSGYHYGANTCEACKGFFRRTLKKKEVQFMCKCMPEEHNLWKNGPCKNGCPSCRYERCLLVGMSRNAIKIGRYTLNHKTENIKEVKSIKTMDSTTDSTYSKVITDSPIGSERSRVEFSINSPEGSECSPMMSSSTMLSADIIQQPSTSVDLAFRPQNASNASSPLTLQEIDTIVTVLTEAHKLLPFDDDLSTTAENMKQKHTEYLEKYKLKTEIFGEMPPLTREEFMDFYETTGIDVDGRVSAIESAMKFFETKISAVVAFAKTIPGFKQLCLDDQSNLIKSSRIESTLISAYKVLLRNVDRELNVITTPWGYTLHLNEVTKMFPQLDFDVILERFKFAERLMNLDLTSQEEAILRAILITFTDRGQLKEPEKVVSIQEALMTCLEHLLSIHPGGSKGLLYKIISVITDMRGLTEKSIKMEKELLVDWPFFSGVNYALLKEFIS